MTPADLAELEAVAPSAAPVERHEVDDPRAWDDLVRLLADLLYPSNPDEPTRR